MAQENKSYSDKLKDPRWQKKRLEILERDGWMCKFCCDNESTLHVHHLVYSGKDPWDADEDHLIALCEDCHEYETINRKSVEAELCAALRVNKYSAGDIKHLAEAFRNMEEFHVPEIMCSVFVWMLGNKPLLKELEKGFFDSLSSAKYQ